jgi:hypothetical protein
MATRARASASARLKTSCFEMTARGLVFGFLIQMLFLQYPEVEMIKNPSEMTSRENMHSIEKLRLEAYGIRALQKLARQRNIPRRSKMTKAQLINVLYAGNKKAKVRDSEALKLPIIRFNLNHNASLYRRKNIQEINEKQKRYTIVDLDYLADQFVAYADDCRGRTALEVHGGRIYEVPQSEPLHIQGYCNWIKISPRTFRRWGREHENEEDQHDFYYLADQIRMYVIVDAWNMAHKPRTTRGAILHLCSLGIRNCSG